MVRSIFLPKPAYWCSVLLLLMLTAIEPLYAQKPLPNSSRECAICHIRWIDAFVRINQQEGVMETVIERQAGSGDMCLSCHDGSVTDSRFKVWSTRHHTTDTVPSPKVKIPTEIFPLDAQGRMTCATCHTAHAVPDSSDIKTVVFLRQPNIDSSLCLACHPEHAQKNAFQHPLGRRDAPVPQVILEAGGKTSADGHSIFCQTCHEPHGARNAWMLVLPPSKLCIACHTDKTPEAEPVAGAPVHRIGHTYKGFEPPTTLLEKKATFGPNSELSCLSCHRLHDASGAWPLLIRKNEDSSLCLECHKDEQTVIESPHDLRFSSPETVNARGDTPSVSGPCGACHRIHGWAREVPDTHRPHSSGCMECHKPGGPGSRNRPYEDAHPVGIPVPDDMPVSLPLDTDTKSIGCLTCHEPHSPRSVEIAFEGEAPATVFDEQSNLNLSSETTPPQKIASQVKSPRSFLRREGSHLCITCHEKMADLLQAGFHEPANFPSEVRNKLALHPSVGPCRVCHTTHNAKGPHLWTQTPLSPLSGSVSDLCGSCHEDKVDIQNSMHDPQTGEWAKKLGFVSKGSCIDCHPVHGMKEESGIWGYLGSEAVSERRCETCHRDGGPGKAMQTPHLGKTLGENFDNLSVELPVGSDGRIVCKTCHDIHQKNSKLLRVPISELCGACHKDKLGIQNSEHDPGTAEWAKNLGFVSRSTCIDCHPVHGPKEEGGIWRSFGGKDTQSQLCVVCHRAGAPGKAMETPHMGKMIGNELNNLPEQFEVSSEGRIACTTCHDIHQKIQGQKLLRAPRGDSDLCLACHFEAGGLLDTPHDLRISAPDVRNVQGELAAESGPCGSCHLVHPASGGRGLWAPGSASRGDFGSAFCTCCHRQGQCAEKHIPTYVYHPDVPLLNRISPQQPGYMPTFDISGKPSPTGAISCLTCHEPHTALSNQHKEGFTSGQKFLRPTENQRFCADCHGIETLWRYLYFHKEQRNPYPERQMNPLSP